MKKLVFVLASSALILSACATQTPYAARSSDDSYGFSEQRIESNRYRVTFRGNSLTSRETVEDYLLYRAAELTLKNGYDYFTVVEDDTEKTTRYRSSGFAGPIYYGRGRRFPYYGYGYDWGPSRYDYELRESNRYTAIAYIVMVKGQKPNKATAYNAREVVDNLGGNIIRPE